MDDLVKMMEETGLPFAYDHFEEGEAAEPPFVCYLLPQSNHFSADGKVYLKITEVHIELYTDCKDLSAEQRIEAVLDQHGDVTAGCRRGAQDAVVIHAGLIRIGAGLDASVLGVHGLHHRTVERPRQTRIVFLVRKRVVHL